MARSELHKLTTATLLSIQNRLGIVRYVNLKVITDETITTLLKLKCGLIKVKSKNSKKDSYPSQKSMCMENLPVKKRIKTVTFTSETEF